MFDNESDLDEFSPLSPEDIWYQNGFMPQEANQWLDYGFDDPKKASEWRGAVGYPDTASHLMERNLRPAQARVWAEMIEQYDGDFPLDEALAATEGSTTLASAYNRHFHVDEWPALHVAQVPARATTHVARLSEVIRARDYDMKQDNDRSRSIMEAARWLGDYSDLTLPRVSLLSNLIMLLKTPEEVPFVLMDAGNDQTKDVSARQALQANNWVQEGGYEADERGLAAYRLITRLDARPNKFEQLIRTFGLQRVVASLETGLDTLPQLQHHLKNGGVAEMARGVL